MKSVMTAAISQRPTLLDIAAGSLAGQPICWLYPTFLERPSPNPGNLSFRLRVVYALSFVGLWLLYPLCRWFAEVKRRRHNWWLSYL